LPCLFPLSSFDSELVFGSPDPVTPFDIARGLPKPGPGVEMRGRSRFQSLTGSGERIAIQSAGACG
jgi:hypothetical protein